MKVLRLLVALPACALVLATTACGDDEPEASAPAPASAPAASTASTPATTASPATEEASEEASEEGSGDCVRDSARLSGSSTVLWVEDSTVPESADDATPATTMTFTDDRTLSPSTLTVEAGEVFAIDAGAITSIHAVVVGCAGAQTLPKGVVGGFKITTPGTYEISDELTEAALGTVTVT